MKALRQTQPSFAKTFRAPRLLVSSSRSRPQTRGNESAQHKLSLPNNSSAVEKLARTAEARLVELIGAETVKRAEKLFDQQLYLFLFRSNQNLSLLVNFMFGSNQNLRSNQNFSLY